MLLPNSIAIRRSTDQIIGGTGAPWVTKRLFRLEAAIFSHPLDV